MAIINFLQESFGPYKQNQKQMTTVLEMDQRVHTSGII